MYWLHIRELLALVGFFLNWSIMDIGANTGAPRQWLAAAEGLLLGVHWPGLLMHI